MNNAELTETIIDTIDVMGNIARDDVVGMIKDMIDSHTVNNAIDLQFTKNDTWYWVTTSKRPDKYHAAYRQYDGTFEMNGKQYPTDQMTGLLFYTMIQPEGK